MLWKSELHIAQNAVVVWAVFCYDIWNTILKWKLECNLEVHVECRLAMRLGMKFWHDFRNRILRHSEFHVGNATVALQYLELQRGMALWSASAKCSLECNLESYLESKLDWKFKTHMLKCNLALHLEITFWMHVWNESCNALLRCHSECNLKCMLKLVFEHSVLTRAAHFVFLCKCRRPFSNSCIFLIMQIKLSSYRVGAFIATLQDLATLPENIVFYLRGYSEFISRLGPWHLRGRPGRDIPTAAAGGEGEGAVAPPGPPGSPRLIDTNDVPPLGDLHH